MPRECTGHSKHCLPTTKRQIYTWTSPDGQHQNQTDYILCSQRWKSSTQSAKTRPGADCGSDHELLIAKLRLKLKKVGKTTKPFRYDLNQIPYDYTVEVRNRFKGLDLTDRVPDELWTEVRDIVQETRIKTIPMENIFKKAKWLSGESLKIAVKRREAKARSGADCGSDYEALIANFRLLLKKVEKATRRFRYDLNQIPYTAEVTNRFKGLDLADRVPEQLWMEVHNIV